MTAANGRAEKLARIVEFVRQLKTGIVYCATRKNVEKVAVHLKEQKIPCIAYHAGLTDEQRTKAQTKFMNGDWTWRWRPTRSAWGSIVRTCGS